MLLFAKRIRELRKSNGLTQEELGKLVNISKVSISFYESGARMPSLDTLTALCDVFKVDLEYLLGRFINATVKQAFTLKYYVSILVEEDNVYTKLRPRKIIGINLGIKDIVITSDNEKIGNLLYILLSKFVERWFTFFCVYDILISR